MAPEDKKMVKKMRITTIIVLSLLILSLMIVFFISDHTAPAQILLWKYESIFPVGTDIKTIKDYAQNKGWEGGPEYDYGIYTRDYDKFAWIIKSYDFTHPNGIPEQDVKHLVGSKSIMYNVCDDQNLLMSGLDVGFAFDENGKLIQVFVRKSPWAFY